MVMSGIMAVLLAATATATGTESTPVMLEVVASGHVETPADRFRVAGSLLACAATQAEADALLAQKVAAIDATMASISVTKARAEEKPSLTAMMGAMMPGRGASECNAHVVFTPPDPTKPKAPEKVGSSAPLSFDAPDRATAARAIAALKSADAKPTEKAMPVLLDDTAARRAAKQQALAKAKVEADSYGKPLGLRTVTLTRISEKQDWSSIDFVGQMFRAIGLANAAPSDKVATDVTLTVEFRLGG